MQLLGSMKSREERVRPKVGKHRVCIFVAEQHEIKIWWCLSTLGSPKYILHIAHSTSITPVSLFTYRGSITMYLETSIERNWRCTLRPRSSELRDVPAGHDCASLEMHLEPRIKWTEIYTLRPWSSELVDAIADKDWVHCEIHSEAVIDWDWRYNWRLTLSELRDRLGGCDWASLELC